MILQKYHYNPRKRLYIEKTFSGTEEEYVQALNNSRTIYVNGIDSIIREERLWHLFGTTGEIRRLIMGINKTKLNFCGFFFVEYETKEEAEEAIVFFNNYKFDNCFLRVSKDSGFVEGRQYGRGSYGGMAGNDGGFNRKRTRYF